MNDCLTQTLQNEIFSLDREIANVEGALQFALVGQRFVVALRPRLPAAAVLTLGEIHREAEKARERLKKLTCQRAKLLARFLKARRNSCRGCPRGCIVKV